ncbi:MAG TPA: hypothetical protein VKE29_04065 [Candidatus Udaeobacter sp.]|nr:hypothetical protein [Candidatus Udaeobacter sp.]
MEIFSNTLAYRDKKRISTLCKFSEVRPRKDHRGVDLLSDALPFGRLWYDTPDHAIGYAMHCSRSHNAVIRVYDADGNVIETHGAPGRVQSPEAFRRIASAPLEREKFYVLANDNDREGFRIIHNWSKVTDSRDFKIVCESLAARLAVTVPTASSIRNRLCAAGILRQTARYVPHRLAARYQWQ